MERILEVAGVLVVMLVVLRFSLGRRAKGIALRGGLTGLNVVTGLLLGAATADLLASMELPAGVAEPLGRHLEASGYSPLASAMLAILPLVGAAAGGMLGYHLLGRLWRRLLVDGSARARAWLRRAQFMTCAAGITFLMMRLRG